MLDSEATTTSQAQEPGQDHEESPAQSSSGRRRGFLKLLSVAVVLAVGAGGAVYLTQDDANGTPQQQSSTLPTKSVVRTDMINTTEVDGTLGYQGSYPVLAEGAGRITWLPASGQVIERGERVYLAMASRGYDGSLPPLEQHSASRRQWCAAMTVPLLASFTALLALGLAA